MEKITKEEILGWFRMLSLIPITIIFLILGNLCGKTRNPYLYVLTVILFGIFLFLLIIRPMIRGAKRGEKLKSRFSALPNDKKEVFMSKAKEELIKENSQLQKDNIKTRAIQIMEGGTWS